MSKYRVGIDILMSNVRKGTETHSCFHFGPFDIKL